jgi:hypothetical protein
MPMLVLPPKDMTVSTPPDTRSSARLASKGTPSRSRLSLTNRGQRASIDANADSTPQAEVKTDGSPASDLTSPSPPSESRSVDEMVTSTSQFSLGQSNAPPTDTVVHIIDDSASEEHISFAGLDGQLPDSRNGNRMDIDQNSATVNNEGEAKANTADVLEHQKFEGLMRSGSPSRQHAIESGTTPSKAVAKKNTTEKPEVAK